MVPEGSNHHQRSVGKKVRKIKEDEWYDPRRELSLLYHHEDAGDQRGSWACAPETSPQIRQPAEPGAFHTVQDPHHRDEPCWLWELEEQYEAYHIPCWPMRRWRTRRGSWQERLFFCVFVIVVEDFCECHVIVFQFTPQFYIVCKLCVCVCCHSARLSAAVLL